LVPLSGGAGGPTLPSGRPQLLGCRRSGGSRGGQPMTSGAVTPGLDDFRAAASTQAVVPLSRRLLPGGETPGGVCRKLAGERPGTFLLESAEHGGVWSRYSFVGVRSVATLTERDRAGHSLG